MSWHTPGPWVAKSCRLGISDNALTWAVFASWGEAVCTVKNTPDSAEDARLIAAAPEMLALLIRLKDAGDWLEINRYGAGAEDGEELETAIDALIAKVIKP